MSRRPSKYGAIRTTIDGVTFASKAEAKRYRELKILERAGEIFDLELQPKFPIYASVHGRIRHCGDKPICTYVADFRYREGAETVIGGRLVVEDVKGMKTPVYRLKKKLVEAQYGIQIQEIR